MKKQFLLKTLLLFSSLLLFSACQTNKSEKTQPTEESTDMGIKKDERSQSTKEELEHTTETTEFTRKEFANGSLIQAVNEKNAEKVQEILKDKDYPINEKNERGETSLLIATHQNFIEIAKILIDAGADINVQDLISDSPYLYAGAQGKTEILSYMLEKQTPDQQKVNRFGGNALIPAAEKGHLENVKLLLKDGRVEIDHQNNYGYTALIEAVALTDGSLVYQQIVTVLLEAGADKNLRDNTGRTAEDYAKNLGYTEILKSLNAN
ncbi:hypothetical protein BCR22_06395 [Enterococcus plantarum]|uniref:ankyrin repeat domain-containing protein n=1 Tax=Enterococcus plantarum TaxID=1077675 RepID=UPI00084DB293|nr:ankyrin repeat domain-containing protein [Enterococcus plantarum]OEG10079.1 hypothetical protein BCR22_06395 [Enterococcus plantarum]